MEAGMQERRKIILKMLRQGFPEEQIIVICDTTKEEIEACRQQNEGSNKKLL